MSIATDTRVQRLEEMLAQLQNAFSHQTGVLILLERRLANLEAAGAEHPPQASKDGRRR